MISYLLVFAGGGLGSVARFMISALTAKFTPGYSWGTLAANLLGSFGAGLAAVLIYERKVIAPPASDFLLAGFLGGLTTFSSLVLDASRIAADFSLLLAILYVTLNIVTGFGLFYLAKAL